MFCINVSDITVIYSLVTDIWHRGWISNFCFMALMTYVNYNYDYDVNQVQRTPILCQHYRKSINQTGPYRTWKSVSAAKTFGLMDRYKCELQSYHSSCRWCSVAISRINSTIMIVQRKLHNFFCWSEPCLHCKMYCKNVNCLHSSVITEYEKRFYWILKNTRVNTMSNTSILG